MRRPGPLKDYASGGPGARSPWGESPQTFDYIKKLVRCQRAPQTFDYIKKLVRCQRAPQTFDYIKNSLAPDRYGGGEELVQRHPVRCHLLLVAVAGDRLECGSVRLD